MNHDANEVYPQWKLQFVHLKLIKVSLCTAEHIEMKRQFKLIKNAT